MKVITWETLYYEDHGATLKHKCGKRIVTLSLLSFSLIFWAFSFFMAFPFLGLLFLWPSSLFSFIPHLGQCSNNDDHHTSIYLQLNDYNLILNKDDSIWMPPTVYRMCNESRATCIKNDERWLCHKYDVNYMIMQSNMTMIMRVIINGMVESCMAIYLGMAMEMP